MANYLAKFCPHLSALSEPLRRLTDDNAEFLWSSEHDSTFQTIKQVIASAPVLRYYNEMRKSLLKLTVVITVLEQSCYKEVNQLRLPPEHYQKQNKITLRWKKSVWPLRLLATTLINTYMAGNTSLC